MDGDVYDPRVFRLAVWRDVATRVKRQVAEGRASVMAGGVAFFSFLALFPAMVALVSTYGLLADPYDVKRQVDALAGLFPQQLRDVIKTELAYLADRSSRTLSIEVAVSILAALWAANKGTRALLVALDMAFGQREGRGLVRLNTIALLFTLGALVFGVISVAALIAAPLVLSRLGLTHPGAVWLAWLRWPALAVVLLLGLALVYRYGPTRRPARWRWVTAGSALATVTWLIGSALFSRFVGSSDTYQRLDGSIAAIAVLLSWFLLSAYVVILGAEVDAAIERAAPP